MEAIQHKIWCDKDEHKLYEVYADFNEWLESEEGQLVLDGYGINGLSQPSKAFFAGDKAAYDQAFKGYRKDRRYEALNESYLVEQFGDEHWFDHHQNLEFDYLIGWTICKPAILRVYAIALGMNLIARFKLDS